MCTSSESIPGSVAPWTSYVSTGEVLAPHPAGGTIYLACRFCDLVRFECDGPLAPVENRPACCALSGRLGLDIEFQGKLVEDHTPMFVERGEFETVSPS